MSLIIATGSNLGDKKNHLDRAKELLSHNFKFIAMSKIYQSEAVDYLDQPEFYNQLLEFELPLLSPSQALEIILELEKSMGRVRGISKGPRVIDIDIIFWGTDIVNQKNLSIPHPSWSERSFVALPLQELPYFETLKKSFIIPKTFNNFAKPI